MRSASLMMPVGMCAAASLCIWAGASLYGANAAPEFQHRAPARTTMDRMSKGDRLVPASKLAADASVAADTAFASVEVTGQLVSPITIRDHTGRVLYSVDPGSRITVIAKRPAREDRPAPATGEETANDKRVAPPADEMPDGCEGAFSPYAAPAMKHVIGRCVSEIAGSVQVAAAAR